MIANRERHSNGLEIQEMPVGHERKGVQSVGGNSTFQNLGMAKGKKKAIPTSFLPMGFSRTCTNTAFLLLSGGPVSQYEFLTRLDSHGKGDKAAMGVDLQSGGLFVDGRVARKLRANLQENALRAARFGRLCREFSHFLWNCHSSLTVSFIL